MSDPCDSTDHPAPAALLPRNPMAWLALFGPGAIIASLTIGTGELIFSTRGGVLFGYRILFVFVLISILKWGLVFTMSRHMVLTGVHPLTRMMDVPGPRGWFPLMLFLLATVCIPIWVGFHSGVLGNLTSWVSDTGSRFHGAIDYLWGGAILAGVLVLSAAGGYSVLERLQLAIVTALILCAAVTLILYHPSWLALLEGALIPRELAYPEWLAGAYPAIAEQPLWVEITRYVGVIGGAGFDYLAYVSFLRDKHWGKAGQGEASATELREMASQPSHPVRQWLRAPLVDCTISFAVVIVFSAVFVASGVVVLGPHHQLPTEDSLLSLQAKFVTGIHPLLLPVYVLGAFLTMLGTLYGTIEVAHVVTRELLATVSPRLALRHPRRLKLVVVAWCGVIAYAVLAWSFTYTWTGGEESPRLLIAILTPANLFTGVLLCGLLCLVSLWMDRRFLPAELRMSVCLSALNVASAIVLSGLGLKGYWDNHRPDGPWMSHRWFAILAILSVVAASVTVAGIANRRTGNE